MRIIRHCFFMGVAIYAGADAVGRLINDHPIGWEMLSLVALLIVSWEMFKRYNRKVKREFYGIIEEAKTEVKEIKVKEKRIGIGFDIYQN